VNRSYAERLIRTEGARITEEATKQAYQEAKIEKYQYDAVPYEKGRSSEICQELNGQIFLLSEAQSGVNYPPMHPNCRSTTIPVFD
jgi:SPP1 gp7 family putative phage head morphogenesis protein